MLESILYVAVVLFLLLHALVPLLVWKQQWIPARYRLPKLDDATFLAEQDEVFQTLHDKLLAAGFAYVASSHVSASQVETYFSVYRAPASEVVATLVTIRNALGNMTYVEFTQVYSDGSVLNVNNSPILSVYPSSPLKLMARLPDLHEPTELYAVMQQLRERLNNSATLTSLREGHELEEIAYYLNREADELIQRGYYAEQNQDNQRPLTLFGAFAFTWKLLWPWKAWFNWLDARQAKRLLQR